MSLATPGRPSVLNVVTANTRTDPGKNLLTRFTGQRCNIRKIFPDDTTCCLTAADVNDAIKVLSKHKDISLVAADMPHSLNRCAICLLMRAYFQAIPFLLISEDNTLDQTTCIHCSRNWGVLLVNRSFALNAPSHHLTRRIAPEHSCSKRNWQVADEDS
jgi:hypothetical protein